MGTVISSIRPGEVPKLLKLIRELAAFEKLEQEVEATEELLHRALLRLSLSAVTGSSQSCG